MVTNSRLIGPVSSALTEAGWGPEDGYPEAETTGKHAFGILLGQVISPPGNGLFGVASQRSSRAPPRARRFNDPRGGNLRPVEHVPGGLTAVKLDRRHRVVLQLTVADAAGRDRNRGVAGTAQGDEQGAQRDRVGADICEELGHETLSVGGQPVPFAMSSAEQSLIAEAGNALGAVGLSGAARGPGRGRGRRGCWLDGGRDCDGGIVRACRRGAGQRMRGRDVPLRAVRAAGPAGGARATGGWWGAGVMGTGLLGDRHDGRCRC